VLEKNDYSSPGRTYREVIKKGKKKGVGL